MPGSGNQIKYYHATITSSLPFDILYHVVEEVNSKYQNRAI